MLSIFVMFSPDRVSQLRQTVECLRDMPLYDSCQRTLVVDDRLPETNLPDWNVTVVPRIDGDFSWANMWDAGVGTARHERILYLDSDRLLPRDYLSRVVEALSDDVFVFTSRHFMMTGDLPTDACRELLSDSSMNVIADPRYLGLLRYEPRHGEPYPGPGKNVMSGNTAFTRKTFLRLGGVDPWYRGHGAFADTDFHMTAARAGCRFVDLDATELHCFHPKLDSSGKRLSDKDLQLLALRNFVYFCNKWSLPIALAETLAHRTGVDKPKKQVRMILEDIVQGSPGNPSEEMGAIQL